MTPLLELLQRLGIFEGDLSDRAKLERYVFLAAPSPATRHGERARREAGGKTVSDTLCLQKGA